MKKSSTLLTKTKYGQPIYLVSQYDDRNSTFVINAYPGGLENDKPSFQMPNAHKVGTLSGILHNESIYARDQVCLQVISLETEVEHRGIGTALLNECYRLAHQENARYITLVPTNEAEGFYRRLGFDTRFKNVDGIRQPYCVLDVCNNRIYDRGRQIKPTRVMRVCDVNGRLDLYECREDLDCPNLYMRTSEEYKAFKASQKTQNEEENLEK